MPRKGLNISLAEARAHAEKHHYTLEPLPTKPQGVQATVDALTGRPGPQMRPPKPIVMTRPEKEYGMILEAMKRRGEIESYCFQGLSLAWGKDPVTGIAMRYKCDWLVVESKPDIDPALMWARLKIIEVKGAKIWDRDLVRFKGCRAEWPMFQFEMHQLVKGVWTRIL